MIEQDGFFLLARPKGHNHTFLPGGHLEPFECLTASLKRELWEEAGIHGGTFTCLGIMENEYEDRGVLHFELCHLFRVERHGLTPAEAVISCEPHLEFLWVKPEQFDEMNLLPTALRSFLPVHLDYHAWHAGSHE